MELKKWEDLPEFMQIPEVRPYWESLYKKRFQLEIKRIFDVSVAAILLVLLALPMIVIAIMIKTDSKGPVFYRQERVTQYGKKFRIHKFRTMVDHADKIGSEVTVENDSRITRVGQKLRDKRLDELPQLFDVLNGDMSFVGTRPEAVKYVDAYKKKYYATLLLPAGITSVCSIKYKDEAKLLDGCNDPDKTYIEKILPEKMKWNLWSVEHFNVLLELGTMVGTAVAVVK